MFGKSAVALSKLVAVGLGALTVVTTAGLLACDARPRWLPNGAHEWLAATPLATIALAYMAYHATRSASATEWFKAALLAAAFLSWAANQVWPDPTQAAILNDVAIAAFVLDVLLSMAGWPPSTASPLQASEASEGHLVEHR